MNASLASYVDRLQVPPETPESDCAAPADAQVRTFRADLRATGTIWRCAALLVAHVFERGFLLLSWACIGAGALSGRLEYGWLVACALALVSAVPMHAVSMWLQGVVAIGFGGVLKQRLLKAALSINPDVINGRGAGAMMSTILESETIDNLGATGGLAPLLALVELLIAAPLLIWGTAALPELCVLAVFGVLLYRLTAQNLRLRLHWTQLRVALTNRLVEDMTAHRTRVAQQSPAEWHKLEDAEIDQYLLASRQLDESTARIEGGFHRGYVIAAVAVIAPDFITGGATLAELTVSLGAILFATGALERFCLGYSRTAAAWTTWRILEPMLQSDGPARVTHVVPKVAGMTSKVLQAHEIGFKYPRRPGPVLNACSLSIDRGDQILLEGASGSGKSTLAAVLAGSRSPSAGYILAGGLDRHTLGNTLWRKRVALAPQYHENHLFSATLAFNLLLARALPHGQQDFEDAATICRELGLGPLLASMPDGIHQFVGETGWRLSQGERSRIFLARALLQRADLVVLDECLAALDPENLEQCIECIMRRAPTAIVIAHR